MRSINLASWDRILRIFIGLGMISIGWLSPGAGVWGATFKVLGFIPLITGLWGWCPVYAILGLSSHGLRPRAH